MSKLVLAAAALVLTGCACSTTWLNDCQKSTPLDYCLASCPHPNQPVNCPIDGEDGKGGGDDVSMPCADCCVARFEHITWDVIAAHLAHGRTKK